MGQIAHACGVGDLKSRPAVMSRQASCSVVHVIVCVGGAMGVVAGVRGSSMVPQAGVSLTVGARRVSR